MKNMKAANHVSNTFDVGSAYTGTLYSVGVGWGGMGCVLGVYCLFAFSMFLFVLLLFCLLL